MKIKLSKAQWQFVGKQAGWMKKNSGHGNGVSDAHIRRISLDTLRMHDAAVGIMGGPDKKESIQNLRRLGYTDQKLQDILVGLKYTTEEIQQLLAN